MKIKLNSLLIITGFILTMYTASLTAQNNSNIPLTTIESVVVDENGNPIPGALVRGNGGSVFVRADHLGKFTISVPQGSELFIEAEGYESAIFTSFEYGDQTKLRLFASPFLEGKNDSVHIAFNKITKREVANAISVINPNEVRRFDNIESISQALSGRVPGMLGGNNIRGIGAPLYVVDGLPRNIDNLNLSEVEQITVLKDINSSVLYGSSGSERGCVNYYEKGEAYKRYQRHRLLRCQYSPGLAQLPVVSRIYATVQ